MSSHTEPAPSDDQRRPYLKRILDDELDEKTAEFSAISIEGPKGVGKTETAQRRAKTVYRLDGPAGDLIAANPEAVLGGEPPTLIDEWQRAPATWDVVRRAVDDGARRGAFLLAGSAGERGGHSGAGRILTLRMRPLTLFERGVGAPTVSLAEMLRGGRPAVQGETDVGLERYVEEIVGSGFPGVRGLSATGRADFLSSYTDRVVEREFEELGHRIRRPQTLLRWMRAYAAATASTASFERIRNAATGGEEEKPARTTTRPYREILERLFIAEPMPAWAPTRNLLSRLAMPPKHHLADPALATSLLGVDVGALLSAEEVGPPSLRDGPMLGALFESLVALSVRVYAQAARASVAHARTRNGSHEIDLVVERRDGRILAIEVKLTAMPRDRDATHLQWLRQRIGEDLLDAVIITAGRYAYRRSDGIAVVPAALLGP